MGAEKVCEFLKQWSQFTVTVVVCTWVQEAGMKLVAEVREGLKQRMNEVDWLDSETRQLAIEKVSNDQ